MAYSSGYWTDSSPGYGLEDAQRDKLDLVCQKIGLVPGMRMLDVGCGWGSLSLHAAQHYGVDVVGVTLSVEQKAFIDCPHQASANSRAGWRSRSRTTARSRTDRSTPSPPWRWASTSASATIPVYTGAPEHRSLPMRPGAASNHSTVRRNRQAKSSARP